MKKAFLKSFFNIFGAICLVTLVVWYLLQTYASPEKVADSIEWAERHAIDSKNKDFFVVDHYSNVLDQDSTILDKKSTVVDQNSTFLDQNSTVLDQNYSNQNSSQSSSVTSNWSSIDNNNQGNGPVPAMEEKSRCDKSCPPKYTLSTDCEFCFLIGQWLSDGKLTPLTGSVQ